MTRALRFLRQTTPEERSNAFAHAWWVMPLAGLFVVMFAAVTP